LSEVACGVSARSRKTVVSLTGGRRALTSTKVIDCGRDQRYDLSRKSVAGEEVAKRQFAKQILLTCALELQLDGPSRNVAFSVLAQRRKVLL
jgi:hypothetical protein